MRRLAPLLVLVVSAAACGATHRSSVHIASPEAAVLRASDMPRGYREGDDTACGIPDSEGEQPYLDRLAASGVRACTIELDRVWHANVGPRAVTSFAYVLRDEQEARQAFRRRIALIAFAATLQRERETHVELGDDGRLIQGQGLNDPAVGIVWRSGNVVAGLVVEPANQQAALRFAHLQERRIERKLGVGHPTSDPTLALNDPGLRFPVYWLGRTFDPAGPLPKLRLEVVFASTRGAQLQYGATNASVTLDLSQPAAWRRSSRTLLGRLIWDSPCAHKTTVQLPRGHADIFQGYGTPRPLHRPCPASRVNRTIAHIFLPGAVVAVDTPYCYSCAAPSGRRNPYETVAGMEAIARRLRAHRRR